MSTPTLGSNTNLSMTSKSDDYQSYYYSGLKPCPYRGIVLSATSHIGSETEEISIFQQASEEATSHFRPLPRVQYGGAKQHSKIRARFSRDYGLIYLTATRRELQSSLRGPHLPSFPTSTDKLSVSGMLCITGGDENIASQRGLAGGFCCRDFVVDIL